jgi:hypothetical protein
MTFKQSTVSMLAAFLVLLTSAPSAIAQIPSWGVDTFQAPADQRWSAIATQDVEAAYRLLRDNHPGAAPELHDLAFQLRLTNAHALALQRARTVSSYQGYLFVLAGFATDIGDKHIWSRPTFVVNLPRWAGIIVSKRGDAWIVTDTESDQSAVLGASLISCDGEAVQDLARKNIGGFHAVWSVGAQQIQNAPWLLIDEGNPFITRPKACVFEHNSQRDTVTLDWVRIKRENLLPRVKKAIGAGAAGFGVRRVGQGYWIALQDLQSDHARAVVKAVEEQKAALREAPYVILDLRGNGGGSSVMGRQIAASLLGAAAADARLGPATEAACGGPDGTWRASEGNIKQLEFLQAAPFVVQGGPEIEDDAGHLARRTRRLRSRQGVFSIHQLPHRATEAARGNTAAVADEGPVDPVDGQSLLQLLPGGYGRFSHARRFSHRPDDGRRHPLRRRARTIPSLRLFNVLHAAIRRPGRCEPGRAVPTSVGLQWRHRRHHCVGSLGDCKGRSRGREMKAFSDTSGRRSDVVFFGPSCIDLNLR